MKSPEEIKEAVKKCLSGVDCRRNCPYSCEKTAEKDCTEVLGDDVNEYIYSLEERVAIMTERPVANWVDGNGDLVTFEKGRTVFNPSGVFCSGCGSFLYGSDTDEVTGAFCTTCGAEMIDKE